MQYPSNGNPPTLFLALRDLASGIHAHQFSGEEAEKISTFLERAYVRLNSWFQWFNSTQSELENGNSHRFSVCNQATVAAFCWWGMGRNTHLYDSGFDADELDTLKSLLDAQLFQQVVMDMIVQVVKDVAAQSGGEEARLPLPPLQ